MKGVILAAGEGKRIKKVTYDAIPKELLPVDGIPTARFPLESMRLAGIRKIMVVIAPRIKHGIVDAIGSGREFGVDVCYVVQERRGIRSKGVGAAILKVRPWIGPQENFIVACGDTIVCDFSRSHPLDCLTSLINVQEKFSPFATILTYEAPLDPRRYGIVELKKVATSYGVETGEVVDLIEKPTKEELKKFPEFKNNDKDKTRVMTGHYVFNSGIFDFIERTQRGKNKELQITDAMRIAVQRGERIMAVVLKKSKNLCYWDVGIPRDFKQAGLTLSEFEFHFDQR